MTVIDYHDMFWKEFGIKKLSPNETLLFFYLLNVWNKTGRSEWFELKTSAIELELEMNKMTITRCRESLKKRGLINFKKGTTKGKNPYYFLCNVTDNVTDDVTDNVMDTKESIPHTPFKENIIYHQQQHAYACERNLEELKEALSGSDIWLESVRTALFRNYKIAMTEDEIKEKIADFFIHLQSEGIDVKTEQDAKSHFKNWIAKVHEIELKKRNDEENRRTYTSKQEANEYAINQFIQYRKEREQGLVGEMEKPF